MSRKKIRLESRLPQDNSSCFVSSVLTDSIFAFYLITSKTKILHLWCVWDQRILGNKSKINIIVLYSYNKLWLRIQSDTLLNRKAETRINWTKQESWLTSLPQQLLTSLDTYHWITDAKPGKMPSPSGPSDTPRPTGAPLSVVPLRKPM